MAKFLDKCPNCGDIFTNYNEQPIKYCSISCQLASPVIDDFIEQVYVGEARSAKSVKVKEDK
jgi:hypothetical protein